MGIEHRSTDDRNKGLGMQAFPLMALCVVLTSACGIDEQVHKKALDELAACQRQAEQCSADRKAAQEKADSAIAELTGNLEQQTQLHASAKAQLEEFMQNLKSTEKELGELRKQREAAEKRANAYRDLNERMRALVDTGKLKVSFRKGQMVLELPSEVLFASGKAELSRKGQDALSEVIEALLPFKDRRFMVAGHTDNQKIKSKRYTNWHLSTARAVSVVQFMIAKGFAPENLGAAGFGEFDPIADNSTKEGRGLNRRLEIILVPDLSELPTLEKAPAPKT